ncbi:mitochondrial ribosomal protein L44 [Brevipalpus obovatus]|uniref:mitochondrial ribosomal protein L44 n=1 Tax=Brevipalpus obovatus TaxID=246614 RepID=UPI003D9E9EC6
MSINLLKSLIRCRSIHLDGTPLISCCFRGMKTWETDTRKLMYERSRDIDAITHPKRHQREWRNWNYKGELYAFIKRYGEDLPLDRLRVAFVDASLKEVNEENRVQWGVGDLVGNDFEHNAKLSQEGQEILSDFTKKYLRYFLPRVPENCIHAVEQFILSNGSLSTIGHALGCNFLIMSPHVDPPETMVASSVKALISLLAQNNGDHHCRKFIIDLIMPFLADKDLMHIWNFDNPQIVLNKILSNDHLPSYEPRLLRETGRNTVLSCYVVGLYVDKKFIGSSPGESIEIAEEMAAYDALRRFFGLTPGKVIFKFGKNAYNLDYESKKDEHPSFSEWKLSLFEENGRRSSGKKLASSMQ